MEDGVKQLFRCGWRELYQIVANSEYGLSRLTSDTVGDKLHSREGNSPDHQLRSPNDNSVKKEVIVRIQPEGSLRGSYP